jgi:hypothetical protein
MGKGLFPRPIKFSPKIRCLAGTRSSRHNRRPHSRKSKDEIRALVVELTGPQELRLEETAAEKT